MQSRIGWWVATGLLALSAGCGNVEGLVDAAKGTLDANRSGDRECANNLTGIKTQQFAFDAQFDEYVECAPWPEGEPGKDQRTWEEGSDFDRLGWHPDADVLGSYSVEIDSVDFTARCVHDADGDGEVTVWEISREESAKRVGDDSEPDSAEDTEPPQDSTSESPLPYCLSDEATRLYVAREDVPSATATLADVSDRELLVGLTQAQLCNEDVQDALTKRRRHVGIAIAPNALNGQALGGCLEAVSSKVCGVVLPSEAGDDVLAALGALDELTDLLAAGSQITDSGLAFLSGADSIRHLDLRGTSIGDDGLAYLAGLTALEVLKLEGTKVTEAGRAHLAGIDGLQSEADDSTDQAEDGADEDGADEDTEGGFLSALFSKLASVFSSESDADSDDKVADETEVASAPDENPDTGEGEKAKREEGKVGKQDAKMERAGDSEFTPEELEVDEASAKAASVLGALNDSSELDGVFGSKGLGPDSAGGIGGFIGAKGTQIGSGGLGSRGSGVGGSGRAGGLKKGRGSGRSGYGSGGGNFGAKGQDAIGAIGGDPIILGALDKSLIDAVIKRNLRQIRYCYQRELTKNPGLGGKIVVKFVVSSNGSVSSATTKSSTMGSRTVESCINSRFMRMKFPEPKGRGIVIVSYPFIFAPG